jgi:hypothetical protein
MRTVRAIAAMAVLLSALIFGVAAPASAAGRPYDGSCDTHDECFWPYPNFYGSISDFRGYDENHSDNYFIGPSSYRGHVLNDFAMSFKNNSTHATTRICANSWFRGPCINVTAGYGRNLPVELANQNSSHYSI